MSWSFNIPFKVEKEKIPTARDYVQDGLIAMWDGIENAGWGVHDPNATVWIDLIGGRRADLKGNLVVEDSVVVDGVGWKYIDLPVISSNTGGYTIELCWGRWTRNSTGQGGRPFSVGSWWDSCEVQFYVDKGSDGHGRFNGVTIDGEPIEWFLGSVDFTGMNTYVARLDNDNLFRAIAYPGAITHERSGVDVLKTILTLPFRLGSNDDGTCGVSASYFALRVYDKPMGDAEIAANYAIDKARFSIA